MADPNSSINTHPIPQSNTQLTPISTNSPILLNLPISTKLTRTNYLAWQCQITPLLHGYGLFKFVDPKSPPPPQTITTSSGQIELNPDFLTWHKQDQILLSWLRSSLSESLLGQTSSATSSAALWDFLQQSFSAISHARLSELHRKLRTTTKGGLSYSDYIQQMRSTADELSFIGAPVSDESLMRHILEGLGPEFNPIVVTANARSEPFSFTDLMSLILSHESLLQSQLSSISTPATPNPIGFYSNPQPVSSYQPVTSQPPVSSYQPAPRPGSKPNSRPPSYRPQQIIFNPPPNHTAPLLPTPPSQPYYQSSPYQQPDNSSRRTPSFCQICSKRGHTAAQCWHRYDSRFGSPAAPSPRAPALPFQAHVALPSSPLDSSTWVIDSGATHHVTGDINNLQQFMPYSGPDALHIGNGSAMPIEHTGFSSLPFSNFSLELCDILHVPSFTTNLLSLSKLLSDNNILIEFSSHFCQIKDRLTKIVLLQTPLTNGLYTVSLSSSPHAFFGSKPSADIWHLRLDHPSPSTTLHVLNSHNLPCS